MEEKNGLWKHYEQNFRVGAVLNGFTVRDPEITGLICREFNSVTCENELKPEATMVRERSEGNNIAVSLEAAAPILKFCEDNGIALRGHTLVWHSQTPRWFFTEDMTPDGAFASRETIDCRLESYIKNMFEALSSGYPELKLYAYDVANECVSDDPARTAADGMREPGFGEGKSPWVAIYGGDGFIERAFELARKYAPEGCSLFYNDYNEYWDHKREFIYGLCRRLYEKGLLDGIGMQSHISAEPDGFTGVAAYTAALEKFASIGCEVQITELDISCERGKYDAEAQAAKYRAVFSAALETNRNGGRVSAVCIWGSNDSNTWIGSDNAPLLFDSDNKPKAAYFALMQAE